MKYTKMKDGEAITIGIKDYLRVACCDCGLTHDLYFETRSQKGGGKVLTITICRNERATGQVRRHRKK